MAFQDPPSTSNCHDSSHDYNSDEDENILGGRKNVQQDLGSEIYSTNSDNGNTSDDDVEIIGGTPELKVTQDGSSSIYSLSRICDTVIPKKICNSGIPNSEICDSGIPNSNINTPCLLNSYPEFRADLFHERPGYVKQNQKRNFYSTPVQGSASSSAANGFLQASRLDSYDAQIRAIQQGTMEQSDLLKTLAQESQKRAQDSEKHWQRTTSQNEQINKSLLLAENAFKAIMELRNETKGELSVFSHELTHLKSVQKNNLEQIKSVVTEQEHQKNQIKSLQDKSEDSDAKLEEFKNQILMMQQGQESRLQILVEKTLQSKLKSCSGPVTEMELDEDHPPRLTNQCFQQQASSAVQSSVMLPLPVSVSVPVPIRIPVRIMPLEPLTKKSKVSHALSDIQSNSHSVQLPAPSQTAQIPVVKTLLPNRKLCAYCKKELSSSYVRKHEEKCRVSRISLSGNSHAEVQAGSSQRILRPRKK